MTPLTETDLAKDRIILDVVEIREPVNRGMSTSSQSLSFSPDAPRRGWRSDGPRFVLIAWLISVAILVSAGIAAVVLVSVSATVRAVLAGEKSSEELRRIAESATNSSAFAWASVIASQIALLACVWLAWRLLGRPARDRFGLAATRLTPAQSLVLLVGTIVPFAIGLFLAWLVGLATGTSDQSVGPLQQMWTRGTKFESIAWVMLIALVPGFIEEVFYRGFLLRGLLLKWGPMASIATSGLLFAIVHGDPVSASAILPLGLWLGFVAWRTGTIWLPFAMHAGVNGVWTTTMMIAHRDPAAESWLNGAAIGALIVGMIAFTAGVVILRRPVPKAPDSAPRVRLTPRVAAACLVSVTVLAFAIPPGTSSTALPKPALLQSPTIAQLGERVSAQVSIASIGQDGMANFTILPESATRLMLPPNKAGVEHVIVALDAGGKIVWMTYSGELTGKGGTRLPPGVLEQLASGASTRLCLSLESHPGQSGIAVRATLEEDGARVAAAVSHAETEGWATRGRK